MYRLGHKLDCIFPSVIIVENPPLFFLVLVLCLLFLNFAGWHLMISVRVTRLFQKTDFDRCSVGVPASAVR